MLIKTAMISKSVNLHCPRDQMELYTRFLKTRVCRQPYGKEDVGSKSSNFMTKSSGGRGVKGKRKVKLQTRRKRHSLTFKKFF